ncbi:helix-turn-helix domain-containing protein [Plantactinospora soyae]|uniref:Transcriptional regulator with XRE-family HTH domain n=1 Tax=Plantactinospora soyae TaxID=1544732 RepID=A0A927MIA1_9ACTN|nr:helix-turn-helix transcriptional regulator [Plantactinospora soyae]MBE1491665.1 transcriptional regulator with XRE-family HTH domain [Plantactinospora soyae]
MSSKESQPAWQPFGHAVKKLIDQRGMNQKELAEALGWAESKVSNIINARTVPKDQDVAELGLQLGASGDLRAVHERCRRGPEAGGFTEDEARQIAKTLHPFLIRAEIRMSTLHRTAACLLGGAALMLLLPLFFPDAPAGLLATLLRIQEDAPVAAVFLGLAMVIVFGVPMWGFILIISDLIGFFFAGHRFDLGADDDSTAKNAVFNPRLGLPGMLAPSAEMPMSAYEKLATKRMDLLGVLLPADDEWRRRFDTRMQQIFRLDDRTPLGDESRLGYAFRLSVSAPRTLLEETAKIELSLAKHILLLRIGLMRFVKTLLLVPLTVIVVVLATSLIGSASADGPGGDSSRQLVELIVVFLFWGPMAVAAVGSPNRWIQRMSPGTGKVRQVYDDPRMVRFENGVVFLALISTILLWVAAVAFLVPDLARPYGMSLLVAVVGSLGLWVFTRIVWWRGYLLRTPRAFLTMLKIGAH